VNNSFSWICAAAAMVIITVVPAVYCGSRSSRWGSSQGLETAAANLDALPRQIGAWKCGESVPLPESARQILKYEASLSRTYSTPDNLATIRCILLVGLPGPIVRHPPEFCYEVRENVTLDQRILGFDSGGAEHSVRLSRFQEPGPLQREFLVATGWFADGRLGTSDTPRVTYGAEPFIYAIQIGWPLTGNLESSEAIGIEFLKALLPAFQANCLKPAGKFVAR
jgi:Protein of unknown function (DUF3485)